MLSTFSTLSSSKRGADPKLSFLLLLRKPPQSASEKFKYFFYDFLPQRGENFPKLPAWPDVRFPNEQRKYHPPDAVDEKQEEKANRNRRFAFDENLQVFKEPLAEFWLHLLRFGGHHHRRRSIGGLLLLLLLRARRLLLESDVVFALRRIRQSHLIEGCGCVQCQHRGNHHRRKSTTLWSTPMMSRFESQIVVVLVLFLLRLDTTRRARRFSRRAIVSIVVVTALETTTTTMMMMKMMIPRRKRTMISHHQRRRQSRKRLFRRRRLR